MRDVRAIAVILLLLLSAACASTSPPPLPQRPFVLVEEESQGDHWRATWFLAEPARELVFERNAETFRSRVFEVLTPGFAFDKRGDREVLRTAGEPVTEIAVRFPEYSAHLQKEYEFFRPFSDGSVAIYTGHLVARPFIDIDTAADTDECDDCFIRTFRFVAPSSPIVADGRVASSPLDWTDEQGQGSYIYFGSLEPLATPQMISIVDPALPDWLEEETRSALPRLFSLYTDRFGVPLPDRPTILFSYGGSRSSGTETSGGTLPGQIQMSVAGNGWNERSDDAMLNLFHFLAHEAVHLWNGQIVHYPDSEDAWMHEGSADGFAQRTLFALGLIDEAQFLEYQTVALNECRRGLTGDALRSAARDGRFDLYYTCGNAIALLTEDTTEGDLFAFWRALIERTLAAGRYTADDYFAIWRERGGSDETIEGMQSFVRSSASAEKIVEMLRFAGVSMVGEENPPEPYRQAAARDALFALLKDNCKGNYGFRRTPAGLVLNDPLDCGSLPAGGAVTAIGGHDVLREGHRAADAAHERCGGGEPVAIGVAVNGDSRIVHLSCTTPLAARPEYVQIVSRRDRADR